MNILDFTINYPDEESCRKKFKELRDQMGVTCRIVIVKNITGLKTNKPTNASVAMHLLTATKGSFSTPDLQRQLGHKRYQSIWEIVNKLRDVIGKRDDEYTLEGAIELDDAFFNGNVP